MDYSFFLFLFLAPWGSSWSQGFFCQHTCGFPGIPDTPRIPVTPAPGPGRDRTGLTLARLMSPVAPEKQRWWGRIQVTAVLPAGSTRDPWKDPRNPQLGGDTCPFVDSVGDGQTLRIDLNWFSAYFPVNHSYLRASDDARACGSQTCQPPALITQTLQPFLGRNRTDARVCYPALLQYPWDPAGHTFTWYISQETPFHLWRLGSSPRSSQSPSFPHLSRPSKHHRPTWPQIPAHQHLPWGHSWGSLGFRTTSGGPAGHLVTGWLH